MKSKAREEETLALVQCVLASRSPRAHFIAEEAARAQRPRPGPCTPPSGSVPSAAPEPGLGASGRAGRSVARAFGLRAHRAGCTFGA